MEVHKILDTTFYCRSPIYNYNLSGIKIKYNLYNAPERDYHHILC